MIPDTGRRRRWDEAKRAVHVTRDSGWADAVACTKYFGVQNRDSGLGNSHL